MCLALSSIFSERLTLPSQSDVRTLDTNSLNNLMDLLLADKATDPRLVEEAVLSEFAHFGKAPTPQALSRLISAYAE